MVGDKEVVGRSIIPTVLLSPSISNICCIWFFVLVIIPLSQSLVFSSGIRLGQRVHFPFLLQFLDKF